MPRYISGVAGANGAAQHTPSWDLHSNEMAIDAIRKNSEEFCSLGCFPLDNPSKRERIKGNIILATQSSNVPCISNVGMSPIGWMGAGMRALAAR
jgi:hypothetical protein